MRGEAQFGQRVASGVARPQWWQRRVVPGLVVDERPLTIGTGLHVPAVAAQHDRGAPASIEDEDRLFARLGVQGAEGRRQRSGQEAALARRELRPQVDDGHAGQLPDRAPGQDDPAIATGTGEPEAVHGWRGRPEDDRGAGQAGQLEGRVARLEPRRSVALVGRLVLLVDDDEADIRQGRQDRQARAHDDVRAARPDPSPLVGPLPVAEAGVDERDPGIQVGPQPVDQRQGQRDLRHQDQDTSPGVEGRGDRLDIDRRLPAAGHAIEQEWPGIA